MKPTILLLILGLLCGCSYKHAKTPSGWEFGSASFLQSTKASEAGGWYTDPNGISIGFGVQNYESEPTLDELVEEFAAWLRERRGQ